MNPWFGKAAVLVNIVGIVVIRAPHGSRSGKVPVAENRKGSLETVLLTIAWITSFLPLLWLFGLFSFADYPLRPVPFALGVLLMPPGFWLFYRSHADLGTNWSITLQVRENHKLVTTGIYARIRHPMYSALGLLSIAQALAVPNRIAGPAYMFGFGLLYVFRVGAEERMMRDRFGAEHDAYARRAGRLFPSW